MSFKNLLCLLLPLLPLSLSALQGTVVDSANAIPLWGCLVTDAKTGQSTRTAKDGTFSLEVAEGGTTLRFTLPGYFARSLAVTGNGLTIRVDIRKQEAIRMGTVTVTSKKEERVSVNRVTAKDIQRRTTDLFQDAMKTVQLMPGVVAGGDMSSLMYVRGGSFYETAAYIDDLFMVNPYLFGGVSSVFNPNMVDSIDFYSGGFPAPFGQAMSGILNVEIRNGCATNTKGFLDISMTTFEGLIEGPLGKDRESSYMVSIRRTYYDLVSKLYMKDVEDGTTFPFFYNLHSKLHIKLGNKTYLDIGTLATYEGMLWKFSEDDALNSTGIGEDSEFHYKDGKVFQSLRLKSALSDKLAFRTSAGWKFNHSDFKFVDVNQPVKLDNDVQEFQSRADFDLKLNKRLSVETGAYLYAAWWDINLTSTTKILIEQTTNSNAVWFVTNQSTSIDNEAWVYCGAHLSAKYKLCDALQLEAGARLEYFNITDDFLVSPRASLLLELGKTTRLKAATGVFQQYPFYVGDGLAINKDYGNQDLLAERARHVVAGFEQDIGREVMLRIEGFYKSYDRLVVYDHLKNFINGAERQAWGFDLFLQKKLGKGLDGWITYSYIKARDRVTLRNPADPARPDYEIPFDTWFSPLHDKRHSLALVLNIALSRKYSLGITLRYATGAPYTPLQSVVEQTDGATTVFLPIWGTYNSARMPDFCRLDVKLSMPFFGIKGASSYFQIINLLNLDNVEAYSYNADYSKRQAQKGLPLMPVFGMKFEF